MTFIEFAHEQARRKGVPEERMKRAEIMLRSTYPGICDEELPEEFKPIVAARLRQRWEENKANPKLHAQRLRKFVTN